MTALEAAFFYNEFTDLLLEIAQLELLENIVQLYPPEKIYS